MKMLAASALLAAAAAHAAAAPPISKSIDFYVNFPGRTADFIIGNNSLVRAFMNLLSLCLTSSLADWPTGG